MLALAALIELPRFDLDRTLSVLPQTWYLFAAASLLGFAVNVTSFLVIQVATRVAVTVTVTVTVTITVID